MPKISRDGFETVEISEDCAGSAGAGAGSATSVVLAAGASPVIGVGSGDVIRLGVSNAGGIEGVKIAFEFSEDG